MTHANRYDDEEDPSFWHSVNKLSKNPGAGAVGGAATLHG